MGETTAKIDEKGRVMIPKSIRKLANLKTGACVNIKARDSTVIIESAESIAEKNCGIFHVTEWPEDLDEFMMDATRRWWTKHAAT